MSRNANPLVQELVEFLGSFKNSEGLSNELRQAISVRTHLQQLVVDACRNQRSILLTGSAGSGKTHLLHEVIAQLEGRYQVVYQVGRPTSPYVLVSQDATELSVADRIRFLKHTSDKCVAKIMAINEGPLREASRADGGETFKAAIHLLHDGQRGIGGPYDPRKPVVIDMRAYDPLEEGLIAELLNLPLLQTVVQTVSSDDDSPRRRAWRFISSPVTRQRIASMVKLAKLTHPDWLFRDIWDFVADLVLGGSDEATPVPTSPWFWRLFFGDSLISRAIRAVANPSRFALPHAEARLWYADWESEHLRFVDDLAILPISNPRQNEEAFLWVKTQCLLLLNSYDMSQLVLRSADEQLYGAIDRADSSALIKRINEYVTFGLAEENETSLALWTDHRIERRSTLHPGLIHLGLAAASEFSIRRSLVVLNHPDLSETNSVQGSHASLIHTPTSAIFSLDRRRLSILEKSRSLRLADREHVEFDSDLYKFFDTILGARHSETSFSVCHVNVEHGIFRESRYSVNATPPKIEGRV